MSGHVALGKMTVMKMAVQAKVFSLVLTCSVSTCGSMILMILVLDCVEYFFTGCRPTFCSLGQHNNCSYILLHNL